MSFISKKFSFSPDFRVQTTTNKRRWVDIFFVLRIKVLQRIFIRRIWRNVWFYNTTRRPKKSTCSDSIIRCADDISEICRLELPNWPTLSETSPNWKVSICTTKILLKACPSATGPQKRSTVFRLCEFAAQTLFLNIFWGRVFVKFCTTPFPSEVSLFWNWAWVCSYKESCRRVAQVATIIYTLWTSGWYSCSCYKQDLSVLSQVEIPVEPS